MNISKGTRLILGDRNLEMDQLGNTSSRLLMRLQTRYLPSIYQQKALLDAVV